MKRRGYIAPIIISVCLLLYYAGIAALLIFIPGIKLWLRLTLLLVPIAVGALIIGVTIQRIRELNSGETDDLNKY